MEDENKCYVTLNDVTGQVLDVKENLWDYLKRKGIIISRTVAVLRSCCDSYLYLLDDDIDDTNDTVPELRSEFDAGDLPPAFPEIIYNLDETLWNEEQQATTVFSSKRKVCSTCCSTYRSEEEGCLRCHQDRQFEASLQQDLFDGNLLTDQVLAQSQSTTPSEERSLSQNEVRERRLEYFNVQHDNDDAPTLFLKINRMKVKEDMIKHFMNEEVCK